MDWINNMTAADIFVAVFGVVVAVAGFAVVGWSMRDTHRKRRRELAERMAMLSKPRPAQALHLNRSAGGPVSASRLAGARPQRTTTTPRASDDAETYAESSPTMRSAWPMWTDSQAPAPAPAFASGGGGDYGGGGPSASWGETSTVQTTSYCSSTDSASPASDSGSTSCSSD